MRIEEKIVTNESDLFVTVVLTGADGEMIEADGIGDDGGAGDDGGDDGGSTGDDGKDTGGDTGGDEPGTGGDDGGDGTGGSGDCGDDDSLPAVNDDESMPAASAGGRGVKLDRDMIVRFKVGREIYDVPVLEKSGRERKNYRIGVEEMSYVEDENGRKVLPGEYDPIDDYRSGRFVSVECYIPRRTFESEGELMVAFCEVEDDARCVDGVRYEWGLYDVTGYRVVRF